MWWNFFHKESIKSRGKGKLNHAEETASLSPPVSDVLTHCRTSLATRSGDSFLLWRQKVQVEDPLREVLILHLHHLGDDNRHSSQAEHGMRRLTHSRWKAQGQSATVCAELGRLPFQRTQYKECHESEPSLAQLLKRLIHFSGYIYTSELTVCTTWETHPTMSAFWG